MEYILITIKLDKDQSYELKVPAQIKAGELVQMLKEAFHLEGAGKKSLHIEPLGRILGEEEVLAEEGVYNGSQIILL